MRNDWNGKKKAITFSYDDGVVEDKRLIEIFDYYGLKGTFNLNSELFGRDDILVREGVSFHHKRWEINQIREIYENHEVAVHTLTHPNLTTVSDEEVVRQLVEDQKNLAELTGKKIYGMAYPGGGVNCSEHVADLVRDYTDLSYARTTISTYNFDIPGNLLLWQPTVYHVMEPEQMWSLGKRFLELETDEPQLFAVWGHSYEFLVKDAWREIEDFCRFISGKEDIFYGTNQEVLL